MGSVILATLIVVAPAAPAGEFLTPLGAAIHADERESGLAPHALVTDVYRPAGWAPAARPWRDRQSQDADALRRDDLRRVGLYKIIAGTGIMLSGAGLAATSGAEVCFPGIGLECIEARSTSRLLVGLGLLGGGTYLLVDGFKDRNEANRPNTSFHVIASGQVLGLGFVRNW